MKRRSSPLQLVFGMFGVVTSLSVFPGCKGDGSSDTRSGLAITAARASRVPQRVVGETPFPEDAGTSESYDAHALKRMNADASVIQVEALKDRERLGLDSIAPRESTGIQLDVEWKQSDLPTPSGAPETAVDALEEARNKTRLRLRVEVAAAGRLRVIFLGQGYPWAEGTELRARVDKYGYVLVWPDGKSYRNVVSGALRAWFNERRLDQGPLFTPKVTALPSGQWLGQPTTRYVLSTPVSEIQLDQATVPGAGLGAPLLCRLLIELAGVEPDNRLCDAEQLPLHAQLTNAPGGKLTFVVTALGKKQELPLSDIQVPPERASFQSSGTPLAKSGVIDSSLLSSLRHRAVAPVTPVSSTAILTPSTGLIAVNRGLSMRALLVDGVTVAWVSPGSELTLSELRNGLYSIAWRDFFGSYVEPQRNVALPARVILGNPRDNGN
jgi:hypothetical protein